MSGLYDRFWIRVTIVLSAVVIIIGFPVFQSKLDFPDSVIWTFALMLGIWATYFIRAFLFTRI